MPLPYASLGLNEAEWRKFIPISFGWVVEDLMDDKATKCNFLIDDMI